MLVGNAAVPNRTASIRDASDAFKFKEHAFDQIGNRDAGAGFPYGPTPTIPLVKTKSPTRIAGEKRKPFSALMMIRFAVSTP